MKKYYLIPIPIINPYVYIKNYRKFNNYLCRGYVNDTYNKIESFDVFVGSRSHKYIRDQLQLVIIFSPIFIIKNANKKIKINDAIKNIVIDILYKYLDKISEIAKRKMIDDGNKVMIIPNTINTWIYVSTEMHLYGFESCEITLKDIYYKLDGVI